MNKKPCIQCDKECDILPVQLGDFFTLTYLRVCSPECMFGIAYDYLYEISYHKDFRSSLFEKQNEEDKALRDEFINSTTKASLEEFRKNLKETPNLLSTPMPDRMLKIFGDNPQIPLTSGGTMRFTRPSKEDKIKWQKDHVEDLKEKLKNAMEELEKL